MRSILLEDLTGYYSLPFSGEPFEGDVIKLDPQSFGILFNQYSRTTEDKFREKLERMDEWFYDKPYRVQQGWLRYITQWMQKDLDTTEAVV